MHHWRLMSGGSIGLVGWLIAGQLGIFPPAAALIGWNVGCASFLALIWRMFVTADAVEVRNHAAREDTSRGVMLALSLIAIGASLAGIIIALGVHAGESEASKTLVRWLAALTLVTSWGFLQSMFIVHYAHRHFQVIAERGQAAGLLFPGDQPDVYMDFVYFAVSVGATAQVSDPGVQSTGLRNLVTVHAVTAFFYNTAVLALGINILSGMLGH